MLPFEFHVKFPVSFCSLCSSLCLVVLSASSLHFLPLWLPPGSHLCPVISTLHLLPSSYSSHISLLSYRCMFRCLFLGNITPWVITLPCSHRENFDTIAPHLYWAKHSANHDVAKLTHNPLGCSWRERAESLIAFITVKDQAVQRLIVFLIVFFSSHTGPCGTAEQGDLWLCYRSCCFSLGFNAKNITWHFPVKYSDAGSSLAVNQPVGRPVLSPD